MAVGIPRSLWAASYSRVLVLDCNGALVTRPRPELAVWTVCHSTSGFSISFFWPGYQIRAVTVTMRLNHPNRANANVVEGGDLGLLILLSEIYAGLLPQLQSTLY